MVTSSEVNAFQPPSDKIPPQIRPNEVTFLGERRARVGAIDLEKQENELDKEEDSDYDLDVLIHELEETDLDDEVDEEKDADVKHILPDQLFHTDTKRGLSNHEVVQRRRKYGLNQLQEEKENLIFKFVLFFVGPIQFVMEVSLQRHSLAVEATHLDYRQLLYLPLA